MSGLARFCFFLMFFFFMGTGIYASYQYVLVRRAWEREQRWPDGWLNKLNARYSVFAQFAIFFSSQLSEEGKLHRKRMYMSFLCQLATLTLMFLDVELIILLSR